MSREVSEDVLVARHLDGDGRITAMPVKRDRRLLVLRHVARALPAGVELDEYTLNNLLRPFSDDVAALRRYLVNAALLDRPVPGRYRRTEEPAGAADLEHP